MRTSPAEFASRQALIAAIGKIFTARRYASAVYAVVVCVCVWLCPSLYQNG